MFGSSHSMFNRKADCEIVDVEFLNKSLKESFMISDFEGYRRFKERCGIKDDDYIPEFFYKKQLYPVFGTVVRYSLQSQSALSAGVNGVVPYSIEQKEYFIVLDNFGYFRMISPNYLKVVRYENINK